MSTAPRTGRGVHLAVLASIVTSALVLLATSAGADLSGTPAKPGERSQEGLAAYSQMTALGGRPAATSAPAEREGSAAVTPPGRPFPPLGPKPSVAWRTKCGRVTCTAYFNRRETRQMRNRAGAMAVLSTVCAATVYIGCVFSTAVYQMWSNMASNAFSDGRCLKIKFPTLEPGSYKRSGGIRCR